MQYTANKIREGSRLATVILYVLAIVVGFVTLYPMYYVLILSVSEPSAAATMKVYTIPKGFTLASYSLLVRDMHMWRAYANTVLYAGATTVLMLITSVLAAFPLTYRKLKGRKYLNIFLMIPMYFSGGMIPSFLLITKLGLYGQPMSQILPASFSIWNIILVKAYFSSIPETLREAAKIDGANVYQILLRVYIPTSTSILAVIAVYTIVSVWNSWFNALVYLPKLDWQPLQLYLRRVLVENTQNLTQILDPATAKEMAMRQMSNAQLKYAMIIFATLPVLVTYPFFQRYFVKGIMLGSLKE
jgi:putative aldouronate transport system permease protein